MRYRVRVIDEIEDERPLKDSKIRDALRRLFGDDEPSEQNNTSNEEETIRISKSQQVESFRKIIDMPYGILIAFNTDGRPIVNQKKYNEAEQYCMANGKRIIGKWQGTKQPDSYAVQVRADMGKKLASALCQLSFIWFSTRQLKSGKWKMLAENYSCTKKGENGNDTTYDDYKVEETTDAVVTGQYVSKKHGVESLSKEYHKSTKKYAFSIALYGSQDLPIFKNMADNKSGMRDSNIKEVYDDPYLELKIVDDLFSEELKIVDVSDGFKVVDTISYWEGYGDSDEELEEQLIEAYNKAIDNYINEAGKRNDGSYILDNYRQPSKNRFKEWSDKQLEKNKISVGDSSKKVMQQSYIDYRKLNRLNRKVYNVVEDIINNDEEYRDYIYDDTISQLDTLNDERGDFKISVSFISSLGEQGVQDFITDVRTKLDNLSVDDYYVKYRNYKAIKYTNTYEVESHIYVTIYYDIVE